MVVIATSIERLEKASQVVCYCLRFGENLVKIGLVDSETTNFQGIIFKNK